MTSSREHQHASNMLEHWMRIRKYNTATLAKQSGIAASVISRIRSDNRDYKFSTAIKLAKGLRITLDQLAGAKRVKQEKLDRVRSLSQQIDNLLWEMDE